jgi:hypothetical protein
MASFSNSNSNVNKSSSNTNNSSNSKNAIWKAVSDDFNPNNGGDRKILRAIARTATVNAVIAGTAVFGPIAAVAGYATGGAITAKRLVGNGIIDDNKKEIVKSLAVFSSATTCSVAGQALTGAVMIGVVGASLPVAGVIAFAVGCVSGITGGALSEWGVDGVMVENGNSNNSMTKQNEKDDDDDKTDKKNIVDSLFNWNKNCRRQWNNKKCPSQNNSVFGNRNKDKKKQQLEDARRMQEELIKEQMKALALDNEVEELERDKVMQEQLVQETIDKRKADESIGSSSWETDTADKDMEGEDTEQHQLQHDLQGHSSEINNDLVTQLSPVQPTTIITTHETLIQADQKR